MNMLKFAKSKCLGKPDQKNNKKKYMTKKKKVFELLTLTFLLNQLRHEGRVKSAKRYVTTIILLSADAAQLNSR